MHSCLYNKTHYPDFCHTLEYLPFYTNLKLKTKMFLSRNTLTFSELHLNFYNLQKSGPSYDSPEVHTLYHNARFQKCYFLQLWLSVLNILDLMVNGFCLERHRKV